MHYCQGKLAYGRMLRPMDFAILDSALRIKTKTSTLLVDPASGKKAEADAALFSSSKESLSDVRLNITGPGEYEVAGSKISAIRLANGLYFSIEADNLKVGVGKMSQISKNQDKMPTVKISIVNLDEPLNLGGIIAGEPSVILLYGENSKEVKDAQKSSKYSVTAEKLPQEPETVVIG